MLIDYIVCFNNAESECKEFEKGVIQVFFQDGRDHEPVVPNFCWDTTYAEYYYPVLACCKMAELFKLNNPETASSFNRATSDLTDANKTKTFANFETSLHVLETRFAVLKEKRTFLCSSFNEVEKERVNEAIHSYFEGCYYSTVAMAVSAVESRLMEIMLNANPSSKSKLDDLTLGQLISEYIDNEAKYLYVVPKKHKPLLQLCNTYRIFSVHPKEDKISGLIASSILSLALSFLTDKDKKVKEIEPTKNN